MEKTTTKELLSKGIEKNGNWEYNEDKPCFIKFFAEWCAPCINYDSILKELSKEFSGIMDFYKVNVEEEVDLTELFKIKSLPTIVLLTKENKQYLTDLLSKSQLESHIKNITNADILA